MLRDYRNSWIRLGFREIAWKAIEALAPSGRTATPVTQVRAGHSGCLFVAFDSAG